MNNDNNQWGPIKGTGYGIFGRKIHGIRDIYETDFGKLSVTKHKYNIRPVKEYACRWRRRQKGKKKLENAIICICLSNIDILNLGTLFACIFLVFFFSFFFVCIFSLWKRVLQYVELKHIRSNDVISSYWHYRIQTTGINGIQNI